VHGKARAVHRGSEVRHQVKHEARKLVEGDELLGGLDRRLKPIMTLADDAVPRPICLGLQGGGAHGAFQWGVIETLLADGRLDVKAITGASAGSMNAMVTAAGLRDGGAEGVKKHLTRFWRDVSDSSGFGSIPGDGDGLPRFFKQWMEANPLVAALEYAAEQAAT
ncbi:patatin-like phospholipase family protein, partial [Staphylococcus aureus]|uniref:patatin-like phospholipase family protein n=1 Tax=Staphylococcus aureus TaxID=1280 RepID=UPI001916612F